MIGGYDENNYDDYDDYDLRWGGPEDMPEDIVEPDDYDFNDPDPPVANTNRQHNDAWPEWLGGERNWEMEGEAFDQAYEREIWMATAEQEARNRLEDLIDRGWADYAEDVALLERRHEWDVLLAWVDQERVLVTADEQDVPCELLVSLDS